MARQDVTAGLMDYLSVAMLDSDRAGLIAVDDVGRVVASNPLGGAYLLSQGGFRERDERLTTHRAGDSATFDESLGQALGERPGSTARPVVVGGWPDCRPLTVRVNSMSSALAELTGIAATVLALDPWASVLVHPVWLAGSLRLTTAEAEVAARLAEGLSIREIAKASARAESSVRSLVKSAFGKTQCCKQSDLVRLVLSVSRLPLPTT